MINRIMRKWILRRSSTIALKLYGNHDKKSKVATLNQKVLGSIPIKSIIYKGVNSKGLTPFLVDCIVSWGLNSPNELKFLKSLEIKFRRGWQDADY